MTKITATNSLSVAELLTTLCCNCVKAKGCVNLFNGGPTPMEVCLCFHHGGIKL